jgi:hypothetical protein
MSSAPAIYEADCAKDGSGGVVRGDQISHAQAIERRKKGQDVVVCGEDTFANARAAYGIETAVGPCKPDGPHTDVAGAMALPHFQQRTVPPEGHAFYETPIRKAVVRP